MFNEKMNKILFPWYMQTIEIVVYATWQLGSMTVEVQQAGEVPNAFHRHMQRYLLGIKWELKNPGLHRTWLFKIKYWIHKKVPGVYFQGYGSRP